MFSDLVINYYYITVAIKSNDILINNDLYHLFTYRSTWDWLINIIIIMRYY